MTDTNANDIGAREPKTLALTLEQVIRVHYSNCFRHGLKPAQWQALRYFALNEASQRTVTAFARHRASTMGTASTTISTLVKKGYLARDYGTGVPRNRGLYLTDKGRELLNDDPIEGLVAALADLPESERKDLAQTLGKVLDGLQSGSTPADAQASA